MSPREAAAFREARAHELHQLADILPRFEVVRSADPLNDAARACRSVPGTDPLQWSLSLEGLTFEFNNEDLKAQRHAKPPRLVHLELQLDVRLSGTCRDDGDHSDPFNDLSVECLIS